MNALQSDMCVLIDQLVQNVMPGSTSALVPRRFRADASTSESGRDDGYCVVGQGGRTVANDRNQFWKVWLQGQPCPDKTQSEAPVWKLSHEDRLQLSEKLCRAILQERIDSIVACLDKIQAVKAKKWLEKRQITIAVMKPRLQLVGCTTAGAAKYRCASAHSVQACYNSL
jgi:hypothetical protein